VFAPGERRFDRPVDLVGNSFNAERGHDKFKSTYFALEFRLETHGPLGTLWVSFGLIAFYIALIWLNSLLGVFLTPLFMIPGTWLLDWRKRRKGQLEERVETEPYQG